MTTTMSTLAELLHAMVEGGARAVEKAAGTPIAVGQPTAVPLETAMSAAGTVLKRSQLSDGQRTGALVTVVPASGLVSSDVALDVVRLTEALVEGALAGIAQAGGPALQAAPSQHVTTGSGVDAAGAEAFGFDLTIGTRSITILWVVEATLGPLLGGSIPVNGPLAGGPSVASAPLPELSRATVIGTDHDMKVLSDVITNVSVEIARGSVFVRDLTAMAAGSIFELDREAGDPVDVLVNGSIVAQGDIVVVGNSLGIRITQIVEPK